MDAIPNLRTRHLLAIVYALTGFTCWVAGDSLMKLAGTTTVPKYEIMAIGCISGMIVLYVMAVVRGHTSQLKPPRSLRLVVTSILFCFGYSLYLVALPRIPLANFYVIIFLSPILLAILSAQFLHEPLHGREWLAIVVGFMGVLIAVNPIAVFDKPDIWVGYGAAFLGMLFLTAQVINMRILGRTMTREALAFYPRFGPLIGGIIAMFWLGMEPVPMKVLLLSCGMGAVGGIGWLLVAQAYKLAPVGTVAPFQYSQILTGALIGYLVWSDIPSLHLLIGGVLIVASGLYVLRHTHQQGSKPL